MSKPFLSGICVTYGRVYFLQEAIQSFLNQDYDGPKELIVYNTCPQQHLLDNIPGLKIWNCDNRPPSLGEARNQAIYLAEGTHIITVDDDDIILPHHFRTYAENFGAHDWLWLDKEFYAEGEEVKGIVAGSCPLFAFTKAAWKGVDGYAAMGVGEDRNFISRITAKYNGAKIPITGMPTFVYRWGQGTFHFSGRGEIPSAHRDIEADLHQRLSRGVEPGGEIQLRPQVKMDWKAKAENYVKAQELKHAKKKPGDDVAIMLLGRYGDIINALPIARHVAENYGRPHWIVSREFLPLFDGVSYVHPVPMDFDHSRIKDGISYANQHYRFVLPAQIWGKNWEQVQATGSYNRESWRMCGFLHKFEDKTWRPIFDRRDPAAEAAYYRKCNPEGKPMLIVNVTKGISSPYPQGGYLLSKLRTHFQEFHIVDVADWDLPHIYDLLGLMERAVAVIGIDTSLLHLAAACDVPIIALVNSMKWQGSEIRGDCLLRMPYFDPGDPVMFDKVLRAVDRAWEYKGPRTLFESIEFPPREAPERRIFHVVERHQETNPIEQNRKMVAWRSWDTLYATGELIPAHLWDYPRNALSMGETRSLPYVKDVILNGLNQASMEDIVMFTNDDNVLHPGLASIVRYWVSIYGCAMSSRCEFRDVDIPPLNNPPDVFAKSGRHHIGRDLFAATKRWWLERWDEIPDWIIGASDWDMNLCAIFRMHFAIRLTRANLEYHMHPAEMPRGFVLHKFHPPKWANPATVDQQAGNIHNRKLFKEWAGKHLPELYFFPNGTI